ncbi:phosphotransferase [Planctobacterium marinum]|uniref:phosphotransferase n=1 Tax=Planctobacterium marinum TaxID=1631968 RepID=UPI001E405A71|nr:phosphotransferase [Planctobacterium marinum]MCC2607019.1 aminoglycoside phosphotransferase family protein [Planctobacterium marinum]
MSATSSVTVTMATSDFPNSKPQVASPANHPVVIQGVAYQYSETLQPLWSGFGEIARYRNCDGHSIIVKRVAPPTVMQHPRGWNSSLSEQRKLQSYRIEQHFYQHYAALCDAHCRVPQWRPADPETASAATMILEDLDAAGYPRRHTQDDGSVLYACLRWLAYFHARFMQHTSSDLWPVGGYWHLGTRPDELANMQAGLLKSRANEIDAKLNNARFTTLIHGDAKLANFCFGEPTRVAALDFQYVGGGVGVKDLALLLASSLDNEALQRQSKEYEDFYFEQLKAALNHYQQSIDFTALEAEWRRLLAFAWADYQRFLMGWKPDHSRITRYMCAKSEQAMAHLERLD